MRTQGLQIDVVHDDQVGTRIDARDGNVFRNKGWRTQRLTSRCKVPPNFEPQRGGEGGYEQFVLMFAGGGTNKYTNTTAVQI